eukprot:CAMPEP_0171108572 /NCGR_PEP_ID=MMETSP0766_2-20121228/69188_1 /TAXON_ID=439317 /ORGANISM="Gambierdiscus australes, Strain CAWD 149" /LENGTH=75 /DNA_ID=CAMNT_0011570133 /DNA_START=1 /DNA_END=225 /DNA_ORIENTATION=+
MYHFGIQAERDFGVESYTYYSWLGPRQDLPLLALRGYSLHSARDRTSNAKWQAFAAAKNRSSYIQKMLVPCMNPS